MNVLFVPELQESLIVSPQNWCGYTCKLEGRNMQLSANENMLINQDIKGKFHILHGTPFIRENGKNDDIKVGKIYLPTFDISDENIVVV